MADPVPAVPAAPAPDVKSGFKTTELYLSMLLLAGLGAVIEQLIPLIPTITSTPGMPVWAGAVVPIAIGALGWAGKGIASEYLKTRLALKLPTPQVDVTAAVAAGAAAANATNDKLLAALNK